MNSKPRLKVLFKRLLNESVELRKIYTVIKMNSENEIN